MDDQKTQKQDKEDKSQKEIDRLKSEAEEYKNKYLRALADYQNFERRVYSDKEEVRKHANKELILRLLPFLDDLNKAESFMNDQGLKMIKNSFFQVLKNSGLEEVDVLEKEFDPAVSEAIDVVKGKRDNIVVEVLRKGYRYQGKLIRPAHVKVEKKV